jgi:hypothetical protein
MCDACFDAPSQDCDDLICWPDLPHADALRAAAILGAAVR